MYFFDYQHIMQFKCVDPSNQPKLKAAVEETAASCKPVGCYREEAVARGRLEIRETCLYARQDNLDKGWESIKLIARVHRYFFQNAGNTKRTVFMYLTCKQQMPIITEVEDGWYMGQRKQVPGVIT